MLRAQHETLASLAPSEYVRMVDLDAEDCEGSCLVICWTAMSTISSRGILSVDEGLQVPPNNQ